MTDAIHQFDDLPPSQRAALLREEANFLDAQIDEEENPGVQYMMCVRVEALLERAQRIENGDET